MEQLNLNADIYSMGTFTEQYLLNVIDTDAELEDIPAGYTIVNE